MSARHDGYRHLPGRPIHQRVLVWLPGQGLLIVDRIDSQRAHNVRSFLHLAPSVALVNWSVGKLSLAALGPLPIKRLVEQHAPWLGTEMEAQTVVQEGIVLPRTLFGWSLLRGGTVVDTIDPQSIRLERSDGTLLELGLPWE